MQFFGTLESIARKSVQAAAEGAGRWAMSTCGGARRYSTAKPTLRRSPTTVSGSERMLVHNRDMGSNDDPRPPRARLLKRDGELGELFPILGDGADPVSSQKSKRSLRR